MSRHPFGFAVMLSITLTVAAVAVAVAYHLPLRDPESAAGPTYLRLPAIFLLALLTDVVPRALIRARSVRRFGAALRAVTRERWPFSHVRFVLLGLGSWYLTYVAFRNLKSYVPFVRPGLFDAQLDKLDRTLLLGHDPAVMLHQIFGVGVAAPMLSAVYIAWIVLVPVSLATALVWSRNTAAGSWYVTAVGVDWVLGVATYYAVPTVGPVYARPGLFGSLPTTDTSRLQADMWADRLKVVHDPFTTDAVQTIAAFASLHVGITVTVCVIAQLLRLPPLVRWALWVFLAVTVIATVYLGWHYLIDALGGAVLGVAGAWVGAVATGNSMRRERTRGPGRSRVAQPVS